MKNKKILITTATLALAGLLLLGFQRYNLTNFAFFPFAENSSTGPTKEEQQQEDAANAEIKQQLVEKDDGRQEASAPVPEAIEITAKQEENNTVTVFTKLKGYSRGDCKLTIQNGSKSVDQQAKVIYHEEFSSCAGFNVPIDSLGKGTWQINLAVISKDSSESENITFEVE